MRKGVRKPPRTSSCRPHWPRSAARPRAALGSKPRHGAAEEPHGGLLRRARSALVAPADVEEPERGEQTTCKPSCAVWSTRRRCTTYGQSLHEDKFSFAVHIRLGAKKTATVHLLPRFDERCVHMLQCTKGDSTQGSQRPAAAAKPGGLHPELRPADVLTFARQHELVRCGGGELRVPPVRESP